jgi:hypothetical protein
VSVPSEKAIDAERLRQLVESQKPAHVLAEVHVGSRALVIGQLCGVGIDTLLGALPAPVLGAGGNVRLRRASVLWPGAGPRSCGFRLDQTAALGAGTIA